MISSFRRILHPLTNFLCQLSAAILYEAVCDDLKWRLSPERRRALKQLAGLKNRHKGDRCFIIGNGPSLNRTDLSKISREYTFGLNKIFLLFEKVDFYPSYYVCVNPLVIEQNWPEISRIPAIKFISLAGTSYFPQTDDTILLRTIDRPPEFSVDPAYGVWEGGTVTYCAMQLAYFMGFSQVILIGVDHFFTAQGMPNETVVAEGPDLDHFAPDYFGKGVKWQLPDLERSEVSYRLAKSTFEKDGLKVHVDAIALGFLEGVEIDYQVNGANASFVFKNVFANTSSGGTCGGCGAAGGGCG